MKRRWTASDAYREHLARASAAADEPSENSEAEASMIQWMSRLRNLYGVPFYYLVPDVRMLPQESIRIFRIDEAWIDCLIDGAFSLGRATLGDGIVERDAAMLARMKAPIRQRAANARARRLGVLRRAEHEENGIVTGFLMRSAAVSGWPGMEVRGFAKSSQTALPIIRIERVAVDILFCLFDGDVASVSLSEAAETIHFGFVPPASGTSVYKKILKYVDAAGADHPAGSLMNVSVNAPFRDASKRVVNVAALAADIRSSLIANNGLKASSHYTPAELALELVEGVQQIDFDVEGAAK